MANELANQVKYGITDTGVKALVGQVKEKEKNGLVFPSGYSAYNAMQSAYLMMKEMEDKNKKPLLEVCTTDSVAQSLMQMVTQGLNPTKKQCYFVAYGNKCRLVPSYFGTLAILNRVKKLKRQPIANVVRQGDVFKPGVDPITFEMTILKHEVKFENMDNEIVAAYAIIETVHERVVEIMTKKQLEQSWGQGQSWEAAQKNGYKSKTHTNFGEEMAKKTVLNRAAKRLINATDDSSMMCDDALQSFNETEDNDRIDVVAENTRVEIEQKANTVEFVVADEIQDSKQVEVETIENQDSEIPDWMNA